MQASALSNEAFSLFNTMSAAKQRTAIQFIRFLKQQPEEDLREEREPSPQLAEAMLEALQISDDSAVKGYTNTKELFEDLNA